MPAQQQLPIKNYVYFFLTTFLLVWGYAKVRERLWPTPPSVWAYAKTHTIGEQVEAFTRLTQTPTGRGLADVVDLTAAVPANHRGLHCRSQSGRMRSRLAPSKILS